MFGRYYTCEAVGVVEGVWLLFLLYWCKCGGQGRGSGGDGTRTARATDTTTK